ncbi:hypothetical protein KSP39_PZI001120 [Platanthera zijinensis]|uniref:Movement protein n=1 Tax=Platanthera zijinensis TaxID=2320716 RepID=A0AAP0GFY7_9ASPA
MSSQAIATTSRTVTSENSQVGTPSLLGQLLRHKPKKETVLEEVLDVEQDLVLYNNHQISLLNPKVLYHVGRFNFNTQLLRINREEELLVTNFPNNIKLISQNTISQIKQTDKKLVHLGLIVIGLKGLARKKLGTKVLITLLDKRWQSDARKAMIAAMEVDMSGNKGIFYCSPDFMISIKDIDKIELGIQSKGYEDFTGHSNLLINIGLLGKLTNNSTTKYKLNIAHIIDAISSTGVKMIQPMDIDPTILEGLAWNISNNLTSTVSIPDNSLLYKNLDNTYSLRFQGYVHKPIPEQDEIDSDVESLRNEQNRRRSYS